jgi:hypothetical protein
MSEMSLVDWFAGMALTGILARDLPGEETMIDQVTEAYEMAEEMIRARERIHEAS